MAKKLTDERTDDLAITWYVHIGTFFGVILGAALGFLLGGLWFIVTIPAFAYGTRKIMHTMIDGSSRFVSGAVLPDTRTHTVVYSHIEALEMKGDVDGALREWEIAIVETPNALQARISAAELYTRKGNNHSRAAQLYREVQAHVNSPDETKRYVTQRLIDLYLGPLNDEGRALVELRRLANRWPDSPEGKGALQAIANIKKL